MKSLPWSQPGRFYRGNLHTHSNRSDAPLEPAAVVAAYRDPRVPGAGYPAGGAGRGARNGTSGARSGTSGARNGARDGGYDFLAITDHFTESYGFPIVDTRQFRTEGFTTLIGAELHAPSIEVGERWHILAVGLPLDFAPPREDEHGSALARRASQAGAFVVLAHPAWYTLTLDDALAIDSADAVEVYNETCRWLNDRGDSWHVLDMLLARGRRLFAVATDDAHFKERPDCRAAWVQVRAPTLEPDALLAALKAGHFYSSQGPELRDVRVEGDQLHVACSPATGVFLSGRGSKHQAALGEEIQECAFPLDRFLGGYGRLTVVDAAGKRAWSNPIWLD